MKSDIDIKDDVYNIISSSNLKTTVTGSLCKRGRPFYGTDKTGKEDICISVIANQTSQIQEAFVNVNIYVQDQAIAKNGNTRKEENTARLRELCQLSFSIFEAVHGPDFRLSMNEQRVIACEGTSEHIINNKLLYQTIND
mgnify:CR=1 FL=1|jgi:hypothetical protein|nr:MAG TPA: hypothetical protein [Caudoviricetes sp.]